MTVSAPAQTQTHSHKTHAHTCCSFLHTLRTRRSAASACSLSTLGGLKAAAAAAAAAIPPLFPPSKPAVKALACPALPLPRLMSEPPLMSELLTPGRLLLPLTPSTLPGTLPLHPIMSVRMCCERRELLLLCSGVHGPASGCG
eukprot:922262-Pelagomonas_calceolata.AAC.10